jgi:hypothetical protein
MKEVKEDDIALEVIDPNEEKSEQHPEGESNIQTQLEEEGELSYKSIVAFGER